MAIAGTNWRLANSLVTLREQINTTYPNRNTASDGTVGDLAHQAQGAASDHNPNDAGVVCAFDITNDPANGLDVQKLADNIAKSRDPRIKYMIFNDRIMVPNDYGWVWVFHYEGSHRKHLHVSVWGDYDNTTKWQIGEQEMTITDEQIRWHYLLIAGVEPTAQEIKNYSGKDFYTVTEDIKRYFANHGQGYNVYRQFAENKIADTTNQLTAAQRTLAEKDARIAQLNEQLKAVAVTPQLDIIPSSQAPAPGTPSNEPIDTKNVNWLVRILINLFGKKS